MRISGNNVFINGNFQTATFTVKDGIFTTVNLSDLENDTDLHVTKGYIIPGFVDIHSHGCVGADFSTCTPSDLDRMAAFYLSNGVTTVLPTIVSSPLDSYPDLLERYSATLPLPFDRLHLEGPFYNTVKKGAQNAAHLCDCTEEAAHLFASHKNVALLSVDPLRGGVSEHLPLLSSTMTVALGHTACTMDEALTAKALGASHITHLFNAMSPFGHREPGLVGAFFDSDFTAELICDGVHVHDSVIRTAFSLAADRIAVVSDSIAACGLADGRYELGGLSVDKRGDRAVLSGSDTIAGSVSTMYDSFLRLIDIGIPPEKAIMSCTAIPARIAKCQNVGEISEGKRADFLVLDREFRIKAVYVGGVVR